MIPKKFEFKSNKKSDASIFSNDPKFGFQIKSSDGDLASFLSDALIVTHWKITGTPG